MENLLTLTLPGPDGETPQNVGEFVEGKIPTGGLGTTGQNAANAFVTLAIVLAITLALFMLVYSGIQWIQSGGDKQKVEAARHRITYTIVGLLVIFFAWFVVNTLSSVFGINLLSGEIPGSQICSANDTDISGESCTCPEGSVKRSVNPQRAEATDANNDGIYTECDTNRSVGNMTFP